MQDAFPAPLALRQRTVGPWSQNAYALVCSQTRHSLLIDPGADPPVLDEMLEGTEPQAILVTHGHPDHIGVLDKMRRRHGIPVLGHAGETPQFSADRWLDDQDSIALGAATVIARHTPGHTQDHLCYVIEDDHRIIVGDAIFPGGPGKTWRHADFLQSLDTLRTVILEWPDQTVCYPGHGDAFLLGDIRTDIEQFLSRDHGQFYGDAEWAMNQGKDA